MLYYLNYIKHNPDIRGKNKKIDNTVYTFDIETTSSYISCLPEARRRSSSSGERSKWSSIMPLPLLVIMRMSVMPELTASSTIYCIAGLSTMGSISFGMDLVAGRTLVPRPAAGITAFVTFIIFCLLILYSLFLIC